MNCRTTGLLLLTFLFIPEIFSIFSDTKGVSIKVLPSAKGGTAWALLVSVKEYQDAKIPALVWPDDDTDALETLLKAQGYDTIVLNTKDIKKYSFRNLILTKLNFIKENAKANDLILFYFSGHGYANPDARSEQGNFIIPADATTKMLNGKFVIEGGIEVKEIRKILESSQARQRVIFIDACRNDPNSKSLGNTEIKFRKENFKLAEGTFMMFGTKPGTEAEDPRPGGEYKNGFFTHYLLKGLGGEASVESGEVTFDSLKNYVYLEMRKAGIQRGRIQEPYVDLANTTYTIALTLHEPRQHDKDDDTSQKPETTEPTSNKINAMTKEYNAQ
jgi:hypothetical protein